MNALRLTTGQKWFALAFTAIALYVFFWTSLSPQPTPGSPANGIDEVAVPLPQAFTHIDLQTNVSLQAADQALEAANAALVADKVPEVVAAQAAPVAQVTSQATSQAWQVGDHRAATPAIPLNERIVDYTIVEMDSQPASYPGVGEAVELPMLNGETIVADVESVVTNPNGDYTWRGHLQGHGDAYPIVMTYGATSTMATITTPAGSYSMTSVKGSGWLYKNPAEVQLVDGLHNDYLEPPQHHDH